MRKLLPGGSMQVRDIDSGIVTGHLFVEDTSASDQIQRWYLQGGDYPYRAPPAARIRIEAASGARWEGATLAAWLDGVRSGWIQGSQFIIAYFRSHSSEQLAVLPEDPTTSPGFWHGGQGSPLWTAPPANGGLVRGKPLQFDVGTSYIDTSVFERSWMYRCDPASANPSFEYCVLSRAHNPQELPLSAQGAPRQPGSLQAFVASMNAQGVWGEVADTLALGACYHGWSIDDVH